MSEKRVEKVFHPEYTEEGRRKETGFGKRTDALEDIIEYHFQDTSLLHLALTHTSYANEHRKEKVNHNERIEFLGDAVLEIVSSDYLYRTFPEMPEGDMTRRRASMVCEPTLALCAREFGLPAFLRLGRGEEMNGGRRRDSIVSDALEALIGAVYLDGGFEEAKRFIDHFILKDIEHKRLFTDSKTLLQEEVQAHEGAVEYVLDREEGPDHDKRYYVTVRVDGRDTARGEGHSKKTAEQHAAYEALRMLREGKSECI